MAEDDILWCEVTAGPSWVTAGMAKRYNLKQVPADREPTADEAALARSAWAWIRKVEP